MSLQKNAFRKNAASNVAAFIMLDLNREQGDQIGHFLPIGLLLATFYDFLKG
jgi:hypothetical protein